MIILGFSPLVAPLSSVIRFSMLTYFLLLVSMTRVVRRGFLYASSPGVGLGCQTYDGDGKQDREVQNSLRSRGRTRLCLSYRGYPCFCVLDVSSCFL